MNTIKAIKQLEELKQNRLSFIHNDNLDTIFLNDIKAINLAIKALKKHPDIKDTTYNCRMCRKGTENMEKYSKRIWTNM